MTIKDARRTQYTIRVDITFNNSVALGNLSGPPWYIRYLGDDRHSRQAGLVKWLLNGFGVPLDLRVSVSLEASKRAEDNTKADL